MEFKGNLKKDCWKEYKELKRVVEKMLRIDEIGYDSF
jgi:hypothetical protein